MDLSSDESKAEVFQKIASCVALIQAKFDINKADYADLLISSPHKDKEKVNIPPGRSYTNN